MYTKITLHDSADYIIKQEKQIRPMLSFDPTKEFETQRAELEQKWLELLCMPKKQTEPVPIIEYRDDSNPLYDEFRFVVETEPEFYVPAHLLLPKGRTGKLPMMICLQGHNDGMHNSMGREAYPCIETWLCGSCDGAARFWRIETECKQRYESI